MNKYYIYSVYQENDVIKEVKTCTAYTPLWGPVVIIDSEKKRESVVTDIENGKEIYTIYENKDGWKLGEKVVIEIIDDNKYIKTKANGTKKDNLDNINQY